jgi:hypothetical protein
MTGAGLQQTTLTDQGTGGHRRHTVSLAALQPTAVCMGWERLLAAASVCSDSVGGFGSGVDSRRWLWVEACAALGECGAFSAPREEACM